MPGKLVLVRHGQSTWNVENLFTGWTDVDLSEQGRAEAASAGRELLSEGIRADIAFTSVLKRAIRTLWITLDELDMMWLPVERSWHFTYPSGKQLPLIAQGFMDFTRKTAKTLVFDHLSKP